MMDNADKVSMYRVLFGAVLVHQVEPPWCNGYTVVSPNPHPEPRCKVAMSLDNPIITFIITTSNNS